MLCVPCANLFEFSAVRNAAGSLHAEAVDGQGNSNDAGDAQGNGARLNHEVANAQVAMALEERGIDFDPVLTRVFGVCFAAADARSAFDAPGAAVVVAHDTAVRLGLRTAATQREQAVAQGFFLRAEFIDEFAVFKVTATLAVVMNGLAEDLLGLAFRIEPQAPCRAAARRSARRTAIRGSEGSRGY